MKNDSPGGKTAAAAQTEKENQHFIRGWNAAIQSAISAAYGYASFTTARELEKQLLKRKR
jgi:hypothetical protein